MFRGNPKQDPGIFGRVMGSLSGKRVGFVLYKEGELCALCVVFVL
jgi:hypothetical protein